MFKKLVLMIIMASLLMFTSSPNESLAWAAAENQLGQPVPGIKVLTHNITTISEDVAVNQDERVVGNITTVSGNIYVSGEVIGNITTATGVINLMGSANIVGNITTGTGIINKEPGAKVIGSSFQGIGANHGQFNNEGFRPPRERTSAVGQVFNALGSLLGLMAVTAIILSLFPLNLEKMGSVLKVETGRVVLVGILGWLVLPFVLLISVLTIVGPFLIGLGALVAVLVGTVLVAMVLGEKLYEVFKWQNDNKILKALAGLVVLWLAGLLPIAHGFIMIVCSVLGMGLVLVTKFGFGTPWFPPRKAGVDAPTQDGTRDDAKNVAKNVAPDNSSLVEQDLLKGGTKDEPKPQE